MRHLGVAFGQRVMAAALREASDSYPVLAERPTILGFLARWSRGPKGMRAELRASMLATGVIGILAVLLAARFTRVLDLIRHLQRELGISMIVVSHDRRFLEQLINRAVVLRDGRLQEAVLHRHRQVFPRIVHVPRLEE